MYSYSWLCLKLSNPINLFCVLGMRQGWEFAHLFSEPNTGFLSKNEQMSDSLIFGEQPELFAHDHSFPLSDLSELLMVAHFW